MDDLDRREAFLLAIFAAPDDDLPRLVFADWLEENGDPSWAEQIRLQCHLARSQPAENTPVAEPPLSHRGFTRDQVILCSADLLADPDAFRRLAATGRPEWYGCTELKVRSGRIASSKPINTLLNSPVTQRVTRLDLSGAVVGRQETPTADDELRLIDTYQLIDFEYRPTVTLQAVEALVSARECRRFTHLDLTNNDLDNDAARAILRSPYLTRLQSLHLFDGNQLRGKTWAQLRDKFGEQVVS